MINVIYGQLQTVHTLCGNNDFTCPIILETQRLTEALVLEFRSFLIENEKFLFTQL